MINAQRALDGLRRDGIGAGGYNDLRDFCGQVTGRVVAVLRADNTGKTTYAIERMLRIAQASSDFPCGCSRAEVYDRIRPP